MHAEIRSPKPVFSFRPRFVGRGHLLAQLQAFVDSMRSTRSLELAFLTGDAGVGKTRVIKELSARLKHRGGVRVLAASSAGRASSPLHGFAQLLATRAGIARDASSDDAWARLRATVADVKPAGDLDENTALLAHILGLPGAALEVAGPHHTPSQVAARTFLALKRFLAADAAALPLVLCLDDLEQASLETLNLLQYLAVGLAHAPVALFGIGRPAFLEQSPRLLTIEPLAHRLDIGPLPADEADDLFHEVLRPVDDVPDSLAKEARALRGMPRLIVEFVRLLVESELLKPSTSWQTAAAGWTVDTRALAAFQAPESHVAILRARLATLPHLDREVLEMAAVCGSSFWEDTIVALRRTQGLAVGEPDGPTLDFIAASGERHQQETRSALARLVRREWIVPCKDSEIPGETEYRFPYPPVWKVVSETVARDARHWYHRVIARWLELRPEGRGEEAQEHIGWHLAQSGDGQQAALRYRRAADAARGQYHNATAVRLYRSALECLGESDVATRMLLWHDLGSVYELTGDWDEAIDAFQRMLRLSWLLSARAKSAVAWNKMGRVYRRMGHLEHARETLLKGLELFEATRDERGVAGSLDDLGSVALQEGNVQEAYDRIASGLERRRTLGDPRSIAQSLSSLGNLERDQARYEEAEACHHEALELRRSARDRFGSALSLNSLAVLDYERGRHADAHLRWEQALAEAKAIGALSLEGAICNNLGEVANAEGKREEARRRLEQALGIGRELDDRILLTDSYRNLSRVELELGHGERAGELAAEAISVAERHGLRGYAARAYLALAEVHAATLYDDGGDNSPGRRAEEFFERGTSAFRELGNTTDLAKGLARYARFKLERGQADEGRTLLRESQQLLAQVGVKPSPEMARMLRDLAPQRDMSAGRAKPPPIPLA